MIIDNSKLTLKANWPAPKNIRAYTCLRDSHVYTSQKSIDYPHLKNLFSFDHPVTRLKQTHSTIALQANNENNLKEGDALFTREPGRVCAILTADCLPILVTDVTGTEVAAIHAGWRGLFNGIIESTFKHLTAPKNQYLVWMGPAIGPNHFEVRQDVYKSFVDADPESESAFTLISTEHWKADLFSLARLRLKKLGIENIYGGEHCTFSDSENFFSYRRDGQDTGRLLSLIWIEDSARKIG